MAETTRQTERDEALATIRRQADALRRRGFDDAPAVDAAADTLEAEIARLEDTLAEVREAWDDASERAAALLEESRRG
jgi:hypothetical protein